MQCFRHRCLCPQGSVVTIGNFDGIHRGHQAIIERTVSESKNSGVPAVLLTFEPPPQQYFQVPGYTRLMGFRAKWQALKGSGLDKLCLLRFNGKIAGLSAEAFIAHYLVEQLRVKHLVVGHDFRFGKAREGDKTLLSRQAFPVTQLAPTEHEGAPISSSRIRQALAAGDIMLAQQLLGRPYALQGRVCEGDKRGRALGFPTANIRFSVPPAPHGVFAVWVEHQGQRFPAVANIGTRPTFSGVRCQLEVHLLDWAGDLYGQHLKVTLLKQLREERAFSSPEALKEQISQDVHYARSFFRD